MSDRRLLLLAGFLIVVVSVLSYAVVSPRQSCGGWFGYAPLAHRVFDAHGVCPVAHKVCGCPS
jgi:hypothetical protein